MIYEPMQYHRVAGNDLWVVALLPGQVHDHLSVCLLEIVPAHRAKIDHLTDVWTYLAAHARLEVCAKAGLSTLGRGHAPQHVR